MDETGEKADLLAAMRSLREVLDRGDHQGIAPSAVFALCGMLDTAAGDIRAVSAHERRELLNIVAELRARTGN